MSWFVYILECRNQSLYTGMTNDLEKRVNLHRNGKAAAYTRSFGVTGLVYSEACATKSKALKREAQIKK
ncbi:MAG TPA: endonuclease [Candidatus Omnitrophica bacterium]|nr:endonuclease [Candidatus Omnitrophota bacterium]